VADPIDRLPPLRDVIASHHLTARKTFGQHFLLDLNVSRRIARAAAPLDEGAVIEIGPGPGGLTRALLLEGAARLIAIESDRRCVEALRDLERAAAPRLEIVEGDALTVDPAELSSPPRKIVANLPYNISTALLVRWLSLCHQHSDSIEQMVLMFQKEVADRLLAAPEAKSYGRLSVITQWLCEVRPLFNLPARAFTPPPKVVSTVVELTPRSAPLAEADMATLEKVTAAAFGQRRKMLRQSLNSLDRDPAALLRRAEIDGSRRAETLSIEEFCALARAHDGLAG
jgi:16S rRNA (adenine1518-N6/adenine1519-N6)-dimethyltransferase